MIKVLVVTDHQGQFIEKEIRVFGILVYRRATPHSQYFPNAYNKR